MELDDLVDVLHGIVFGSVALTVHALMRATGGVELTFIQWRVVLVVGAHEGGCRVGEVARSVRGTLPGTSRLLRRLERRGLVSLERDERDRRATLARLTPEGERVRAAVLEHRRAHLAAIAERIKPPNSMHLLLRDLADQLEFHAK